MLLLILSYSTLAAVGVLIVGACVIEFIGQQRLPDWMADALVGLCFGIVIIPTMIGLAIALAP